jgi:hypothetical protein
MSKNAFDMVRKIRHLPGIRVTAVIEPLYISKRVKNAAQKMLRSGVLTGGYSSTSRMLAEQLLGDVGLSAAASNTKWGVRIRDLSRLTKDARAQVVEFVTAARMIELTTTDRNSNHYTNDRYDTMLKNLKKYDSGEVSFSIYQPALQAQIAEIVAACRTPEEVAAHGILADRLDRTQPFEINI